MAERLGISQQAHARFEDSPETPTLERLSLVFRTLDVEISWTRSDTQQADVASNSKEPW